MSDQAAVNAEELRKALDQYEQTWAFQHGQEGEYLDSLFADAARSWLALYDEATVEKVAAVIAADFGGRGWSKFVGSYDRTVARAVVAAITEGGVK